MEEEVEEEEEMARRSHLFPLVRPITPQKKRPLCQNRRSSLLPLGVAEAGASTVEEGIVA